VWWDAEACFVGGFSETLLRCGTLILVLLQSLKHHQGGCYISVEDEPAYLRRRSCDYRRRQATRWRALAPVCQMSLPPCLAVPSMLPPLKILSFWTSYNLKLWKTVAQELPYS
jgi:hypothetical protein